ncbi:MAG: GAF and ANTAR domain-containing protein [Actinomycetota bacterium]|nr:GAF and ANTAR domain-containing protein [Actinomycetota bacterium]
MSDEPDPLSRALESLARHLVNEESLNATLERVARLACRTIGDCDAAGITLVDGGRPATAACTDEVTLPVDRSQYESGEGPCLEAYRQGKAVRVATMADDERWPEFRRAAMAHGFCSSLSLPLVAGDETLGALNLYSRNDQGYSGDDEETGSLFAAQAAVAVANAKVYWSARALSEQLEEALASRDVIGQAKGIIMAQRGGGPDDAFDVLRRASQRENVKLRDVAQAVVDSARRRSFADR